MKIKYALLVLVAFSGLVNAAASGTGKVEYVRIDKSGRGVIKLALPLGVVACGATYSPNDLAFSVNEAGGRAILATALAAQAEGVSLQVTGTGLCGVWGDWVEDASVVTKLNN